MKPEIIIKGKIGSDPRDRVLALEAATRAICESAGTDPADMNMTYSDGPIREIAPVTATALGHAIVAADDFFKLRTV